MNGDSFRLVFRTEPYRSWEDLFCSCTLAVTLCLADEGNQERSTLMIQTRDAELLMSVWMPAITMPCFLVPVPCKLERICERKHPDKNRWLWKSNYCHQSGSPPKSIRNLCQKRKMIVSLIRWAIFTPQQNPNMETRFVIPPLFSFHQQCKKSRKRNPLNVGLEYFWSNLFDEQFTTLLIPRQLANGPAVVTPEAIYNAWVFWWKPWESGLAFCQVSETFNSIMWSDGTL